MIDTIIIVDFDLFLAVSDVPRKVASLTGVMPYLTVVVPPDFPVAADPIDEVIRGLQVDALAYGT